MMSVPTRRVTRWGTRIVFGQEFATRVGNVFRKFYGVQNENDFSEKSYDRYTRGLAAVLLGFGIVVICLRGVLISHGIL